ncbi:13652_t:CDS:1, partial [Racocetra persica]
EFEKALFTSVQTNLELIGYYNNLHDQYKAKISHINSKLLK